MYMYMYMYMQKNARQDHGKSDAANSSNVPETKSTPSTSRRSLHRYLNSHTFLNLSFTCTFYGQIVVQRR